MDKQNTELDSGRLDRISQFEARMEVVKKNDEELEQACRAVHGMLTTAGYLAIGDQEKPRDENRARCYDCGWLGKSYELLETEQATP